MSKSISGKDSSISKPVMPGISTSRKTSWGFSWRSIGMAFSARSAIAAISISGQYVVSSHCKLSEQCFSSSMINAVAILTFLNHFHGYSKDYAGADTIAIQIRQVLDGYSRIPDLRSTCQFQAFHGKRDPQGLLLLSGVPLNGRR